MKKRFLTLMAIVALCGTHAFAQEKKDEFKISGYIQAQAELVGKDGKSKTGANTAYGEAYDGDKDNFLRYGLRRSRIKLQYTKGIAKGVFEMDLSEGGIKPRNAFVQIDPLNWLSLQAGLVTLWYGHEVGYSSSDLEVLERSKFIQDLFPDEKDLALRLTLKSPKGSQFEGLKLDLGLVSGQAINKTLDGRVNFLGRLGYSHASSTLEYGFGLSYYHGTTNNSSTEWYEVNNNAWEVKSVEANSKNKRQYLGVDAQLSFESAMGLTNIRGEFSFGTQPSQSGSLKSPNGNTYSSDAFNYNRKFIGSYLYLIQDIYMTPLTALLKWAYVDNNSELSGDDITNKADLAYNDFGLGLMYRITPALRLTLMYDINVNEKTNQISKYSEDVSDNIMTLRLQYKF